MIDLLRKLLVVREAMQAFKEEALDLGVEQSELLEIEQMMKLERDLFAKVNEWDKE